ncbi:hypothetical protein Dimus_013413 [Dionaea muscipula]
MNPRASKALTHILSPSSPHHFLLRTTSMSFTTTAVSCPSTSLEQQRLDYDGGRNVRVSVWWDFENCGLPAGANVCRVAQFITAAVRANGIKGPVHITAFGDVLQLSRANQGALSATGVNLAHIPGGDKNSADRSLLVDLMYWVSQNPPPAHLFLISGDRDFASVLHRLRMNNYNILLASRDTAPNVLCSAASIMWRWNELVKGENLMGRHFNQPPDGPLYSWYGQFKVPLEDPYAVTKTPGCSGTDDSSDELPLDCKVRPVPKAILKFVRHILNSHPNGLSGCELRAALGKSNIQIDRDFYGYKKFSRLLMSMPEILKLQFRADGQLLVTAASPKIDVSVDLNSVSEGSAVSSSNQECVVIDGGQGLNASKTNGSVLSVTQVEDNIETAPSPHEVDEKEKKVNEDPRKIPGDADLKIGQDPPGKELSSNKEWDAPVTGKNIASFEEQTSANLNGVFSRRWAKWLNRNKNDLHIKISKTLDQFHDSSGGSESLVLRERYDESTNTSAPSAPDSRSLAKAAGSKDTQSDIVTQCAGSGDAQGNKVAQGYVNVLASNTSPGFFAKVVSWCRSWKTKSHANVLSDQSGEGMRQIRNIEKQELILTESHWRDAESFINTYSGSSIILNSRSREDIAQDLQMSGPATLQSLSITNLLHLVHLLISEKKWIEECPSQTYPFRVIQTHESCATPTHTPNASGLSSIFLCPSSQSDSVQLTEDRGEKKVVNVPHSGVSSVISKASARKSRTEVLADCRKLVEELLKENPAGFNIRCFRRLFIERCGYMLDHEKLGYPKLGSLLQLIPGVKIESNVVCPARVLRKDLSAEPSGPKGQTSNYISQSSLKDDNESPWDELGPVENSKFSKEEVKEGRSKADDDYESSLSDDDLSELEEEASPPSKVEAQSKSKINDKDSSLLQLLDSWYSNKVDSRDCADSVDDKMDSRCSSKAADSSRIGAMQGDLKNETSPNYAWRQRPAKSYTFVSDSAENNDKLIDGLFVSLRKSGESKVQV